MTDIIDFTNKTRAEFEAWCCPDGVARKIRTLVWGPNTYVKFVKWVDDTHFKTISHNCGGEPHYTCRWETCDHIPDYHEPSQSETNWKEGDVLMYDGEVCTFGRYVSEGSFLDTMGCGHVVFNWQLYTEPKQSEKERLDAEGDRNEEVYGRIPTYKGMTEQSEPVRDDRIKKAWAEFTEPKRDEPEQVDTSTPEGFKAVLMELADRGAWHCVERFPTEESIGHFKKEWSDLPNKVNITQVLLNIKKGITYRIKPQRVPAVGDVWEDEESDIVLIINITCDMFNFVYFECDKVFSHDRGNLNTLNKYIGKIDLSLLKGTE